MAKVLNAQESKTLKDSGRSSDVIVQMAYYNLIYLKSCI